MFIRIQTNRAKLKEILLSFGRNAAASEVFIAPRPLPKERFKFYIAFASVEDNSRNHRLLETLKNHKIITKTDFDSEVSTIEYYWKSGGKNV